MSDIIVCFIIFGFILLPFIILGLIDSLIEKKIEKQKKYIVRPSFSFMVMCSIIPIGLLAFIVTQLDKLDIYGSIIWIVIFIVVVCIYILAYTFKIEVDENKFTIIELYFIKHTYSFEDLTSYKEYEPIDTGTFTIVAYIGDKKVLTVSNDCNGYDKIEKKIKKYAEPREE